MMIELHRQTSDDLFTEDQDDRIAIDLEDIRQVHVGRGGVTIVTTSTGRIPVQEDYDTAKRMIDPPRSQTRCL